MSFATGEDVMRTVEALVSQLPTALNAQFSMVKRGGDVYPVPKHSLARINSLIFFSSPI
jgi:aspartyl-tRNA synthetase